MGCPVTPGTFEEVRREGVVNDRRRRSRIGAISLDEAATQAGGASQRIVAMPYAAANPTTTTAIRISADMACCKRPTLKNPSSG